MNILISGAGTATCQSIIKAYRNQSALDVHVTTVDMNPDSAGRYLSDAFYQVPSAHESDFISRMLDICQDNNIQLFIPTVDYEFLAIARSASQFDELGCTVAISSETALDICMDKLKLYQFFLEHNIPTIWTADLSSLSGVELEKLVYPVFVKPRVGRASLNASRIDSPEALKLHQNSGEECIVQDYLEGQEYTIDVLNDFQTQTVGAVPRARLETKSGVSYKGRTEQNPDMINMSQFITETIGIIGHANIQCFRTADGIRYTEVNPRYSGTMVLSLAAGFNSPLMLAKLALGESLPSRIGDFRERIQMLRYWEEIFVDERGYSFQIRRL